MNKIITVALIAGGLLLLDSPEAAAHKQVRNVYEPAAYQHVEYRRAKHMPRWLHRDKAFRRWYKRTHLRKYRRMTWHRLYDVYLWERSYGSRRGDRVHYDYDHYGHARRHEHRGERHKHEHRDDDRRDGRRRNRH